MKDFFENLFIVKIWDYYHQHVVSLSWSFILGAGSLFVSEFGLNLAAIIAINISSLFFLRVYLDIPKAFGLFRGLLSYIVIVLIAIYCFSNVYIEHGIIFNEIPTKEFKDTIYFSTVTWTTLGYGDFRPSEEARIWAATESMLGYIYMGILVGLLISGLTPKENRYAAKKYSEGKKYSEK